MDLFGRRWALRVLWELRDGPVGARALLARCEGMSSSVLYERLRDLAEAALIEKTAENEYQLTHLGGELGKALHPLDAWARRWSRATPSEPAEDLRPNHERSWSTTRAT